MTTPQSDPIDGLSFTMLKQIPDHRGAVLHMMRCDSADFTRFGECYFSETVPAAVKAWKRHRLQTQNLAVPVGRIRIAVYDLRESSGTHGNLQVLELGRPDAYGRLRIPPGLWYGFQCISTVPALIVNCADFPHEPADGESRPTDDPAIPYRW